MCWVMGEIEGEEGCYRRAYSVRSQIRREGCNKLTTAVGDGTGAKSEVVVIWFGLAKDRGPSDHLIYILLIWLMLSVICPFLLLSRSANVIRRLVGSEDKLEGMSTYVRVDRSGMRD
jgi:hypothetical protein